MRSVWPSHQLPAEEGQQGRNSPHGATPTVGCSGHGADPGIHVDFGMHGAPGQWKDHGAEGFGAAARPDPDSGHQHDHQGVQEAHGLSTGVRGAPEESCKPLGKCHSRADKSEEEGSSGTDRTPDGGSVGILAGADRHGLLGSSRVQEEGPRAHSGPEDQGGGEAEGPSPVRSGSCGHLLIRGGEGAGEEQEEGKFSSLWASVKALQQRIRHSKPEPTTTCATSTTIEDGIAASPTSRHGLPETLGSASPFQGGSQQSSTLELPAPGPGGGKRAGIPPSTARKMSANAAMIGAVMMLSVRGLMAQLTTSTDFMEIACAPTSSLSASMEGMGYNVKRINFKEGYDLQTKAGTRHLADDIKAEPPKHAWVSLPCTRLTGLVNLTQRDEWEEANFQKRQQRDLRRADEVVSAAEPILETGGDLSWEWPTTAKKGWSSKAINRLVRLAHKHHRHIYWCNFHGCAYGLTWRGHPVQKSWTVATTCREVWLALQKRCPGHTDHVHCRGQVAQASSYYPELMVKSVTKAIAASWSRMEEKAGTCLANDVTHHLVEYEGANNFQEDVMGMFPDAENDQHAHFERTVREEEPHLFALTRQRYPQEPPTGKRLEAIKAQMLRVHKSSGHASFHNLARLLRIRKAPQWAIELALSMQCPDCVEAKRPPPTPVASLHETPSLFEIVGTDVFEYEHNSIKYKFLLLRDRASGLMMVELLKTYGGLDEERETAWEPNTEVIIRVLGRWTMTNPSPKWLLSDSATYFTSEQMDEFLGRSGIGHMVTPAEAHHLLGPEEGAIALLKGTAGRLLKEVEDMEVELAFTLAAHGQNESIGPSGFSAFQWTRGASIPMEGLPLGIDPKKAFGGMLRLKEKARVAHEMESARQRLSKLNNTIPHKIATHKPGSLVMLWRQRNRPGKVSGGWQGPVRVLLQESQTLWLASGSSIVRARTMQVRPCTRREELQASLEGMAIIKMPVTLESLLRNFTGRHFSDVTGETPSLEAQQEDLSSAEVRKAPAQGYKADSWKFGYEGDSKWLIRCHTMPRLRLFDPSKLNALPVDEDQLTGQRRTKLRGIHDKSEPTTIEDNYKETDQPGRSLQERWVGETWLELTKTAAPSTPAARVPRTPKTSAPSTPGVARASKAPKTTRPGRKRKASIQASKDTIEDDEVSTKTGITPAATAEQATAATATADPGTSNPMVMPEVSPLTSALREKGVNAVDGTPEAARPRCSQDACVLLGGHPGYHEDDTGRKFTMNSSGARVPMDDTSSSASSSSDSSDEMIPDEGTQINYNRSTSVQMEKMTQVQKGPQFFYALEIPISPSDAKYLTEFPEKSSIWLSRKMQEKGREVRWAQLSMDEKVNFDMAQAKELSNVLSSKALRSLTESEEAEVDPTKVMDMCWVLTVKGDGSAKARLVVLGFQMAGLGEIPTAAPTMSRVTRSLLLTLCANKGYRLKAGDVTSAFLQAEESLEPLGLTVKAPAELATLFGADPKHPVK